MVDSVKINNLTTKDLETNFELDVSDNSIPICYISKISYPTFDANTTLTYLDNIKYIDDFKNSGIKILLTQKNLIKNISLNPEICFVFTLIQINHLQKFLIMPLIIIYRNYIEQR